MDASDVLSLIVGALFLVTGGVKVVGLPQSLAIRDHFGIDPQAWRLIGLAECAGAVGVVVGIAVDVLGLLALIGLGLLMIGAIVSRVRVHDPARLVAGDVLVLALVIATALVQAA
jgi:hypothetical protein